MIRTDDLFINGLKIYQDTEGFCFGTDSLLLAKFAFVKKTLAMCDLCTGTAVLPLLASAETLCEKIYGVEISPEIAALANRSVCFNGLGDKINIIEGDVRDIRNLLPGSKFDLVTVNPPYMSRGGGFLSCGKKTAARAETECSLADVCAAAAYLLKNRGRLCVVSRADRLSDLFDAMKKYGLEPKRLVTVQSKPENAPYIILCEAVVGASPGLIIEKPLVLDDGKTIWSYYERK